MSPPVVTRADCTAGFGRRYAAGTRPVGDVERLFAFLGSHERPKEARPAVAALPPRREVGGGERADESVRDQCGRRNIYEPTVQPVPAKGEEGSDRSDEYRPESQAHFRPSGGRLGHPSVSTASVGSDTASSSRLRNFDAARAPV
jgi:hypothetical protein